MSRSHTVSSASRAVSERYSARCPRAARRPRREVGGPPAPLPRMDTVMSTPTRKSLRAEKELWEAKSELSRMTDDEFNALVESCGVADVCRWYGLTAKQVASYYTGSEAIR